MTMNVILGAGTMPTKEVNATLTDLWRKDTKADEPHWYLIQGKSEPTETDKAIVAWLHKNEIWYDVVSDGEYDEKLYSEAQGKHTAKRLAPKVVTLMKGVKAGNEEDAPENTQLLALFTDLENFEAEEDRWLNDVGTAVQTAGFTVLALNDGLIEIDMLSDDEPPEEEEQEEEQEETDDGEAAPAVQTYAREELLDMDRSDVLKIAKDMGIELPPKTRIGTYVKAILGEDQPELREVEVENIEAPEEPAVTKQYADANTGGSYTTGSTMTGTLSITSISAPAMMIVIYNGSVTSRSITSEEALALIQS